uniref:Kinesin-like protein KIF6/9 C-terminal domain-containing protein n=1 Tax=Knipowitschia caucasica TaxID=637954 RepID=A0AAV2JFY2_KNICA
MHSVGSPKLSMGKQEAFKIFLRDHKDRQTIEENKTQVMQRSIEAKGLGEQMNETRTRLTSFEDLSIDLSVVLVRCITLNLQASEITQYLVKP